MANIDQYIEQIENARYGKEVRQAIVDALIAMNAEISSSGVTSFNERVGNVVSADGDYNISQISATGGMQGQVPVVNNNGGFTMRDMTGEVVELNQLTDVNISSPSDGQVLKYDSTNEEWVNDNDTGGTTVVANPSGTASENLTKLQVGDSIYDIPQSGDRTLKYSVTADGVKTYKEMLYELFQSADVNDLTNPDNMVRLIIAMFGSQTTISGYIELYPQHRTAPERTSLKQITLVSSLRYNFVSSITAISKYQLQYTKDNIGNFHFNKLDEKDHLVSDYNEQVVTAGFYANLYITKR